MACALPGVVPAAADVGESDGDGEGGVTEDGMVAGEDGGCGAEGVLHPERTTAKKNAARTGAARLAADRWNTVILRLGPQRRCLFRWSLLRGAARG